LTKQPPSQTKLGQLAASSLRGGSLYRDLCITAGKFLARGRNWHGAFYTYHPDETITAMIDVNRLLGLL